MQIELSHLPFKCLESLGARKELSLQRHYTPMKLVSEETRLNMWLLQVTTQLDYDKYNYSASKRQCQWHTLSHCSES